MFRTLFTFLFLLTTISYAYAQISCNEIMENVQENGHEQASYCCFDSKFLTGVKFYSIDIDYNTYYFAIVQFNFGKWYIYQVPSSSKNNFSLYAYGNQAGEAFHDYIHAYRNSLGCAPEFR